MDHVRHRGHGTPKRPDAEPADADPLCTEDMPLARAHRGDCLMPRLWYRAVVSAGKGARILVRADSNGDEARRD